MSITIIMGRASIAVHAVVVATATTTNLERGLSPEADEESPPHARRRPAIDVVEDVVHGDRPLPTEVPLRSTQRTLGAVILCAGASTRMGFPKFLLDVGRRSALTAITDVALEVLDGPIIAVTRLEDSDHVAASSLPEPLRVRAVVNPHPERGRTGSLQCGLAQLESTQLAGCLVWPVDVPLVSVEAVRLIARALEEEGTGGRVVPVHESSGGHPVGVGRDFWPAIHDMDPDEPLRDLFRRPGPAVRRLPVEDEGIRANLDTPEDVARWLGRPASPWPADP